MTQIRNKLALLLADTPKARAIRSKFRKVKNLPLSEAPDVWSFIYGTDIEMKPWEEKALYTTLIIASVDSQREAIRFTPENSITLGEALRRVRNTQINQDAFSDKMTRLVDSADYETFTRRLISLLRQGNVSASYYEDLYQTLVNVQSNNKDKALQRLAKTYYQTNKENN